jgi:hypothetical protein
MIPKQTTNANGDLILTFGPVKYIFREPRGRDLVNLERIVKAGECTDAETLAAIMAQQNLDNHDADFYLDLPIATFKNIGLKMLESFRSEDK